jgi:5-methylcytosine-specific restriction endonuclease McrA
MKDTVKSAEARLKTLQKKAKSNGATSTVSIMRIVHLLETQHTCPLCGRTFGENNAVLQLTLPFEAGGAYSDNNIRLSCAYCNRCRSDATDEQFLEHIRLTQEALKDMGFDKYRSARPYFYWKIEER